jgi:hypothetical protein
MITTEYIFEEKVCTKGFIKQEIQVKKMLAKQAMMGIRAQIDLRD